MLKWRGTFQHPTDAFIPPVNISCEHSQGLCQIILVASLFGEVIIMHDCEVISKTRAMCFVRVSKHRETIKALGRFICVCFFHPGGSFSLAHKNPHVDHWNWTNGRYYQKGFPLQNIKTRHKTKHNEMGLEHLIKTITHSWRVGAKIMKQPKQVLKKIQLQTTKKEGRGRLFFGFNMQNQDTGLPALVVALCSNRSKCSNRNWMPCNGVESLSQLFECCFYHSVRNL